MNNIIYKSKIKILFLIFLIFVNGIICSYASSANSATEQILTYNKTCKRRIYPTTNSITSFSKINDNNSGKFHSKAMVIIDRMVFNEDLYKKYFYIFIANSIFIAAFSTIIKVLKSIKRMLFDDPLSIHIHMLVNYIHRVDGEWGQTSLCHSF